MNTYTFDVSFSTGVISSPYFTLVVNDHNSTTFKFKFDQDGRYVFKMLYPDGTCYVQDIVNNELILGKGVLNQDGNYRFEISLYGNDNRLTTSLTKEFPVRLELVDTDVPVEVDDRVPILDNLIEQTNTILQEAEDGKFDGATFTPSVNENGDLSWTNDKGKENPQTVNIMGPQGEPGAIKLQVVESLPEIGESDTIYLIEKEKSEIQNIYDEYIYTNNTWEKIGDTAVDLSDYYNKDETDKKLSEKQNSLTAGENITIENNVISASSGSKSYSFKWDGSTDANAIALFQAWYDHYVETGILEPITYTMNVATGTNITFNRFLERGYITFNIWNKESTQYYGPSLYISYTTIFFESKDSNIIESINSPSNLDWQFLLTKYDGPNGRTYASRGYQSALATNNTTEYTPASDYNPATKKYVDDSISSAITDALGGSY